MLKESAVKPHLGHLDFRSKFALAEDTGIRIKREKENGNQLYLQLLKVALLVSIFVRGTAASKLS